jgi:hypothetical protein
MLAAFWFFEDFELRTFDFDDESILAISTACCLLDR